MSVFPLWYAADIGGTTQIWGHAKKNFRREFVPPPNFKTVSAPMIENVGLQWLTNSPGLNLLEISRLQRERRVSNPFKA